MLLVGNTPTRPTEDLRSEDGKMTCTYGSVHDWKFQRCYKKIFIEGLTSEINAELKNCWNMFAIIDALDNVAEACNDIPKKILQRWYDIICCGLKRMYRKNRRKYLTLSPVLQMFSDHLEYEYISENNVNNWMEINNDDLSYVIFLTMNLLVMC